MRDDQPADDVARPSAIVLVADGDLDVTAERQLGRVAAMRGAGTADGLDALGEPIDVRTEGERHAVGVPGGQGDHPRVCRGHVHRRRRDVERGNDRPEARHGADRAVHLHLPTAQEAEHLAQVGLEAPHRHRLALQHLHGTVSTAEREARASAGDALDGRHRAGGQHGMPQRHRHRGVDLQRGRRLGGEPEGDIRVRQQAMGLAHGQAVPAVRLHLTREATDLRHRYGCRPHAPELSDHRST